MMSKTASKSKTMMLHVILAALANLVLENSILYFDVQRSGQLPKWQRITFRADSGLNDGRQDNASH
jgi:hypothetical protein